MACGKFGSGSDARDVSHFLCLFREIRGDLHSWNLAEYMPETKNRDFFFLVN